MRILSAEKQTRGREIQNVYKCNVDGVTKWVPLDPDNADYRELKKQEREGKIVITEREV